MLADAYGGYHGIVLKQELPCAGCRAHARRKFIDCQTAAPQATQAILHLIKYLFALESNLRNVNADERLRRRQAEAVPLLELLSAMLLEQKATLLPKHPLSEAVQCTMNQWAAQTLSVADPAVPIHNNLAEQHMEADRPAPEERTVRRHTQRRRDGGHSEHIDQHVPPAQHQPAGLADAAPRQPARHASRRSRPVAPQRMEKADSWPTNRTRPLHT